MNLMEHFITIQTNGSVHLTQEERTNINDLSEH